MPALQIRIILMKIRIRQDADQQGSEMSDPDPHQNEKWIRINIRVTTQIRVRKAMDPKH
jgi:hypothetical protein